MQQLAGMILIKGWGRLLLQELCNSRELGIKAGLVLMMCWCLQENRVFSQLGRGIAAHGPEHKALQSFQIIQQPRNQRDLECRDAKICNCASFFFSLLPHLDTLRAQQGGSRSGTCLELMQEPLDVAPGRKQC